MNVLAVTARKRRENAGHARNTAATSVELNYRVVSIASSMVMLVTACQRRAQQSSPAPAPPPSASVRAEAPPPVESAEPISAPALVPEAAKGPRRYRVFGVTEGDVLNVRAAPNHLATKVQALVPHAEGVRSTTRYEERGGGELWVQLEIDGALGWANRAYLTEMPEGDACADPRVNALAKDLARAITTRDGALLSSLLSPARSLIVRSAPQSPSVRFDKAAALKLFSEQTPRDWGPANASGGAFAGAFRDLLLPALTRATSSASTQRCGEVVGGAGSLKWPSELQGLLQYSFYAADPAGTDWVSCVAGLEFVNSQPYVAALVQYRQEM